MNKFKRYFTIILTTVLAFFVVVYIGAEILISKETNEIKARTENITNNETADWKTYKNEKYGFEFKYPAKLGELVQRESKEIECSSDIDNEISLTPSIKHLSLLLVCDTEPEIEKYKGTPVTIVVNGKQAKLHDYVSATGYINKDLYIPYSNGMSLVITHSYKAGREDYVELSGSDFKEIAKSFKFTDLNLETTDWKTYRNEEYGFEFEYPYDWKIMNHKDGPIVSVAPIDYVFKDGTETPYGLFFVWPIGSNLVFDPTKGVLNKSLEDSGWVDDFGGKFRYVMTEGHKFRITMVGGGVEVERILSTFKFTN